MEKLCWKVFEDPSRVHLKRRIEDEIEDNHVQTFDMKKWALRAVTTGANGVKNWNSYTSLLRKQKVDFDNVDFSHLELAKIDLDGLSFNHACFEKAVLSGAFMQKTSLRKANLKQANLEKARCAGMDATEADFTEANFKGALAESAIFKGANLEKADLTGAIFKGADLQAANLSGSNIGTAMLNEALFDEKTVFPAGFVPSTLMVWGGQGEDPRRNLPPPDAQLAVTDYDTLIKELWGRFDPERIQRALGMLQSEKFHLFADVSNDTVIGVARSQTTEERVYACVLKSNGIFGCCTQNLRRAVPCARTRLANMCFCCCWCYVKAAAWSQRLHSSGFLPAWSTSLLLIRI